MQHIYNRSYTKLTKGNKGKITETSQFMPIYMYIEREKFKEKRLYIIKKMKNIHSLCSDVPTEYNPHLPL